MKPDMRFYKRACKAKGSNREAEAVMLCQAAEASMLRLFQFCPVDTSVGGVVRGTAMAEVLELKERLGQLAERVKGEGQE